jgi:hypothetical protein
MRVLLFILGLSVCIGGCKPKKTSAEESLSIQVDTQPVADSVKIVGERILGGEPAFGKNEKYLFPLLDSVTQKNKNARQFYFKVLGKIVDQSEGHLAESIGAEVLKYIESDPIEFIQNSKAIGDSTFKTMAYYSVDQISISTEDQPKAQQEFEKLKGEWIKKMEKASDEDKARLNDFLQFMQSSLNSKAVK